ncbi:hypothetical protein [Actinomadura rugatobispora]|uniref:Helix-turn-helix domain-containing protein n=1 Tax=Actinomadura rugatobispora TaxID=1994 RepID=A0ABW1AFW2_9ACTN|nr:hypothetical protein GCM10010200_072380 [Actinomadura rugatobispora]
MTKVRIAENRQVVTDLGHHQGGTELDVPQDLADQWIRYGWAEPVREPGKRAGVRARIREQLAADPSQSNRAVAETVGCDHKTVGSVRAEMERDGEIPQQHQEQETAG